MTLSTSELDALRRQLAKTGFVYLCLGLLCALLGAVYETFSHGVYSNFMVYAFLIPLTGGTFPFCAMAIYGPHLAPGRLSTNLYHSGIATLTVGSFFQGALEIYGTSNRLVRIYWVVGGALVLLGMLAHLAGRLRRGRPSH